MQAERLPAIMEGQAADQLTARLRGCETELRRHADYCDSLASQLRDGATSIELGQLTWLAFGAVLVTQLAADAVLLHVGAAKAAADRAVVQSAWRRFLTSLLEKVAVVGEQFTLTRTRVLLTSALFGGLINIAVSYGAQVWQQVEGNRNQLDYRSIAFSGLSGVVGGLAGAAAAHAAAPAVSRAAVTITNRFGVVPATVASTFLLGSAGGVGGAIADTAVTGVVNAIDTGEFTLNGKDFFTGMVYGIVGGVVGGSAYAVHAAQAGIRTPAVAHRQAGNPVPSYDSRLVHSQHDFAGIPPSSTSPENLPATNPPQHDNLLGTSKSDSPQTDLDAPPIERSDLARDPEPNHPPVREGGDENRSTLFSDEDRPEGIWSGAGDVKAYEKWRQSERYLRYGKFWLDDELPGDSNSRLRYAYPQVYGYAEFKVKSAFEPYRDGIFNGSDSTEVSAAKGVEFRKAAAEMAALPHSKEYPLDADRIPSRVEMDLRNYRSLAIVSGWKDQVPVSEPEAVRVLVEAGVLDPNNPEIDPRITLGWPDEVLARGDGAGPLARVESPVGDDTQPLDSGEHVVPAQGEPDSTHSDALLESQHDRDQRRELGRRSGHEAALTALPDDVVWATEDAMAKHFEKAPLYATRILDDRVPGGSRVLHFRVAGDPHGYPVMMSPGSPVGVDGPLPDLDVLTDRGFALIIVERPGYGASTRLPDRQVADCARDIMHVADLFALDRYSVLGRSGGGSTAICVGALDPRRVERAVPVGGLSPKLDESGNWSAGMAEANRAAFDDGVIMEMAQRTSERGEWLLALNEDYFTELDYKWAGRNSDLLAESYQRGLRENREAWVDDVIQVGQPWGIEFDDYRVPVDIVHGTADQFSPVQHSYTNALVIPTSKLFLYDGVSHMMGLDLLPVILSHFRSERDAYMSDMDKYHPGRSEQVRAADAKPLPFPRWQLWEGVGWKPRPELGHTGPVFRPLGL
ncbi:alpha/beta hydrolase [Nocardia sp. NPDC049190]|uniref:alpha/beta fold hydrolase n=1 Tax=Nocardia sp. NPDC049190 TaxID=3155650 RepID=UPI00340B91EC